MERGIANNRAFTPECAKEKPAYDRICMDLTESVIRLRRNVSQLNDMTVPTKNEVTDTCKQSQPTPHLTLDDVLSEILTCLHAENGHLENFLERLGNYVGDLKLMP